MFVASLICTVRFSISPLIMLFSFIVAFTWYLIFAAYAVVITRPSPITPIRIIVNKRILLLLLNISSFMKVYPLMLHTFSVINYFMQPGLYFFYNSQFCASRSWIQLKLFICGNNRFSADF